MRPFNEFFDKERISKPKGMGGLNFIRKLEEPFVFQQYVLTQKQLYTGLIVISIPLLWISSAGSTIFWIVGASATMVLGHASFLEPGVDNDGSSKVLLDFRRKLIKRSFTSTNIVRAAQEESVISTEIGKSVQPTRKPIGGFRGGLIGFLVGLTIAGGAGYYYLLDEYHAASNILLSSVEELQKSTNKVRDYTQKIDRIESELKALQNNAATTDQIKELRGENRKLYDVLNLQHLELKGYVYGIDQDLQTVLKKIQ
ncbi:18693_t:CDS:2 [Funneliformis geosporum]|nr:18693_t:CDS:2 [Funneliformis geosporum]